MDINEILNGVFTPLDFATFNNIGKSAVDIEQLKKTGTVLVSKIEDNGLVSETVEYTSFDGKEHFIKSNSYYIANAAKEALDKINEQIKIAVSKEDFESASILKEEKDAILLTPKRD